MKQILAAFLAFERSATSFREAQKELRIKERE
jgi:hypothetical protein